MAISLGSGIPGAAGVTAYTRPITPVPGANIPLTGAQSEDPRQVAAKSFPGMTPMAPMGMSYGADVSRGVVRRRAPEPPVNVAPIAEAEMPDVRMPQPQMRAVPQTAPGGLGGLGGWQDVVQAVGQSMMTGGHGNWLGNYPQAMAGIQARRREEAEAARRDQDRMTQMQAMEGALVEIGFAPEEARRYAGTPEAARLVMTAREQARQREEQAAARARADAMLRGGDRPPGGSQGQPPPLGFRYGASAEQGQPEGAPPPLGGGYFADAGQGRSEGAEAPAGTDPYAEIRARDAGITRLQSAAAAYEAAGDTVMARSLMARAEALGRDRDLLVSRLPRAPRSRESDAQIEALVARGVPREEAENIAYGFVKTVTDPVLGGTRMANVIEGTLTPLEENGRGMPAPADGEPLPPEQTLYENADEATGAANSLRALAADTLGQVPGVGRIFDAPETVQARQLFANATNDLIRALSINPRFPVGEIERIRREINLDPSAFRSPEAARNRMLVLDQYLTQRYQNEVRAFQNPNLPAETRMSAAQAAEHIRNFRIVLGVPNADAPAPAAAPPGEPSASPPIGTVEEGFRFMGGDPADPSSWEPVQ